MNPARIKPQYTEEKYEEQQRNDFCCYSSKVKKKVSDNICNNYT